MSLRFRYKLLLTIALFCGYTYPAFAQHVDTCKVGIFVSAIYDLDYVHASYASDYWLWSLTDTNNSHPLDNFEFPNSKNVSITHPTVERRGGIEWASELCKATVRHQWNTTNFPFDVQVLNIVVEENEKTSDKLVYVADENNSKISPWVKLDGWAAPKFKASSIIRTYPTTYGDPDLSGGSSFPAVNFEIRLERTGVGLFFKIFSGVYIAFAIAMMVFFFAPNSEIRYSLAVGALFAAVANKYIIDSLLPPTIGFTLVDKVHVITFFYILGIVLFSGVAMHLHKNGKHLHSEKLDRIAMWLLLVSYIAVNSFVILRAGYNA
jgi:hypothetical protein